ncbi:hypothetical protein [Pontibacillus marinus]|uniref:Uncharacterized protein n=1 Tax=Pontibacillus marinus BH030004 = DSM 16465 TaxID=1385511 RepID=A0A0A5G8P5_9BACI|nr:hypothetical protein [Pontibacillus marinus]KGX89486.1 hypothetical protein N783_06150 [Pontibacillus marinus BH030004 = DSM 16465]
MSAIISSLIYLFILFGASTLLFSALISLWHTDEPVIAYLLSLIVVQLLLNTFGDLRKRKKES